MSSDHSSLQNVSAQHIALTKAVLVLQLTTWDALLALEDALDMEVNIDEIDAFCSGLDDPAEVTDEHARRFLELYVNPDGYTNRHD
jgi:hypothetical protein